MPVVPSCMVRAGERAVASSRTSNDCGEERKPVRNELLRRVRRQQRYVCKLRSTAGGQRVATLPSHPRRRRRGRSCRNANCRNAAGRHLTDLPSGLCRRHVMAAPRARDCLLSNPNRPARASAGLCLPAAPCRPTCRPKRLSPSSTTSGRYSCRAGDTPDTSLPGR